MSIKLSTGYIPDMRTPGHEAMALAKGLSGVATELEFWSRSIGESSVMKTGDRVYFITVEGDFPGTVARNWRPSLFPASHVYIVLDHCKAFSIHFHRSLFRAFTVLDHIAQS